MRLIFIVSVLGVCGSVSAENYALLIGVSAYPGKESNLQLDGPKNDVKLMQKTLVELYQFKEQNVVILSDDQPKSARPTYAHIVREWEALINRVQKNGGDQVFVLMAGHGSRAPRKASPDAINPHRLTGLFLPSDIGAWDDDIAEVERSISDVMIEQWCQRILAKGATMCLMMDSCHSGGIAYKPRGAENEKYRDLDPVTALGVPAKVLNEAIKKQKKTESFRGRTFGKDWDIPISHPQMIAMYACRSSERTPERMFPSQITATNRKSYGLFTYMVAQEMRSGQMLNYETLLFNVNQRYTQMGMREPHAYAEGRGAELLLFSQSERVAKPIRLTNQQHSRYVDAGTLHGMSKGSILAVYPPVGAKDSGKVIGHVKLLDVSVMRSKVVPVAYDNMPKQTEFSNGSVCIPVYIDSAHTTIFQIRYPRLEGKLPPKAGLTQVAERLNQYIPEQLRDLVKLEVDDSQGMEWQIHIDPKTQRVLNIQRPGNQEIIQAPGLTGDASVTQSDQWCANAVLKIARMNQLMHIAGKGGGRDSQTQVSFSAKVRGRDDEGFDKRSRAELVSGLHPGDVLKLQIKNTGQRRVDVALVHIDTDYACQVLYPGLGAKDNRLNPNETRTVDIEITPSCLSGLERILLIAVNNAAKETANFYYLEEEGIDIEKYRSKSRGQPSPLDKLLEYGHFRHGGTRGAAVKTIQSFKMDWISYETLRPN